MESSYEITKFLPLKIEDGDVLKYVQYHAEKLDQSIENNIESWIFFHTHILYMTFVYFQLLRISQFKEQEFKYSWIWLSSNEKDFLKKIWSPFAFSAINERTVFRFFRLIDFDDWTIWNISKCVNERNDFAHATWIHIGDLDEKIEKYFISMETIINKSKDFLNEVYFKFKELNPDLLANIDEYWKPNTYEIQQDDLETNLYIPFDISEYEWLKLIEWNKEDKVLKALKENL